MSIARLPSPPSSSLPRLREPETITETQITTALRNVQDIFCPLPRGPAFRSRLHRLKPGNLSSAAASGTATPLIDSGYASGTEDECPQHGREEIADAISALRADVYERNFAIRWLTTLIGRAEELILIEEDVRQRAVDDASYVLASFSAPMEGEGDEEECSITRDFSFALPLPRTETVDVRLNDGNPATGDDHTDVGLQSWGASILISDMMCSSPARFGLTHWKLGDAPRIIELGAGTGLVGIAMAKLLPRIGVAHPTIVATDYHPAVLANLRDNIAANFEQFETAPVQTCLLDWSAPCLDPPLDKPVDMLIATDVVYAPEHAAWLRDCAARLLAPHGVFWLIASVRPNGRFEGISDTVEAAFANADECPRADDERVLRILEVERLEKRQGVGRADEVGYKVFRIGWAQTA